MIDLGELYWMTKKELEWDAELRRAGLTLVIGAGDDPGPSTVLARLGSDNMDMAWDIDIRWGGKILKEEESRLALGFSVLTIMDETTMNAVIYRDGKYIEVPPLSERELTFFPYPIGYQYTYAIIHSELATLPWTINGVRNVTYKDTWDEELFPILEFPRDIGFTSRDEIDVLGQSVSPFKVLASLIKPSEPESYIGCLKVSVRGLKGGVETVHNYYLGPQGYNRKWNASATAVTTAMGGCFRS